MIFVTSETLPVDMLMFVLTVPLLVLVLWLRVGFLRGEVVTEGAFSLMTEGWRFMWLYASSYISTDIVGMLLCCLSIGLWL